MKLIPIDDYTLVNKVQHCYYDTGGNGEPIILIHGFPLCKEMWRNQVKVLKNTHRVIAYDLRGYGCSLTQDDTEISMDLFADDLISFMEALHIEKAIVCGFSMGGYILLNALERYPNHVKAAILCDTQCIADSEEVRHNRYKSALEIENQGLASFAEGFLLKIFNKSTLTFNHPLVRSVRRMILSADPKVVVDSLHAIANRSDTCEVLNQISVPTLIICGNDDMITPVKQAQYLHNNIKGSILSVIDDAGHMSNLEQPNEFNAAVMDFISHLPKEVPSNLYGQESLSIHEELTT